MSIPLSSLLPSSSKREEPRAAESAAAKDITGSIPLPAAASGDSGGMTQADWAFAGTALRAALGTGEEVQSVPWSNPNTGAKGTFTPITAAQLKEGFACRDFLASRNQGGRETWFEGTACRVHRGEWDVRAVRPMQKS